MPFYRFKCTRCEYKFKELLSSQNITNASCPKCGWKQVERLPSKVSIQYKTKGFYSTKDREGEEKDG